MSMETIGVRLDSCGMELPINNRWVRIEVSARVSNVKPCIVNRIADAATRSLDMAAGEKSANAVALVSKSTSSFQGWSKCPLTCMRVCVGQCCTLVATRLAMLWAKMARALYLPGL